MRRNRNSKVGKALPIFIVIVMVGSLFMVFNSGGGQVQKYGDYVFKYDENQGIWAAKINGNNMAFRYHPTEVESIDSVEIGDLSGKNVMITYNSSQTDLNYVDIARFELTRILEDDMYVQVFNTPDVECGEGEMTTIKLTMGNETKITQEGECIILEAAYTADILRVGTRLEYQLLGII